MEVALHWVGAHDEARARNELLRAAGEFDAACAYRDAATMARRALEQWPEGESEDERIGQAERDAFAAKAEQLIVKYSVDRAKLDAARGGPVREMLEGIGDKIRQCGDWLRDLFPDAKRDGGTTFGIRWIVIAVVALIVIALIILAIEVARRSKRAISSPSSSSPAKCALSACCCAAPNFLMPCSGACVTSRVSTKQSARSRRMVLPSVITRLRPFSSTRPRILDRHQRSSPRGSLGTSHSSSQRRLRGTAWGAIAR